MQKSEVNLTVFFNDPFWIGILERITERGLEVCKVTFGSEPKDYEIQAFLLEQWHKLKFSFPVRTESGQNKKVNPKRMQRTINKQLRMHGVGTKSQQALKLWQENKKLEHKEKCRKQYQEEKQRQFELKQHKRREKHRGH